MNSCVPCSNKLTMKAINSTVIAGNIHKNFIYITMEYTFYSSMNL